MLKPGPSSENQYPIGNYKIVVFRNVLLGGDLHQPQVSLTKAFVCILAAAVFKTLRQNIAEMQEWMQFLYSLQVGECRSYLMSRGFFGPNSLSLAFPKRSPLREKFNPV